MRGQLAPLRGHEVVRQQQGLSLHSGAVDDAETGRLFFQSVGLEVPPPVV